MEEATSSKDVPPAQTTPRKPQGWSGWLVHLLGVQRKPEKGFRLRFRFFVLLFLFLCLIGLLTLTAYSTSPSFCRSCHIMEPYYEAWVTSGHNGVACVDCHYPPGSKRDLLWHKFQALSQVVKYVTRTYSSKPYAEVEDASCLRSGCHATQLLRGRVVSERGVLFDHKPHLESVRYGRQLRCVSCHSQVVVGKHIEVTWDTCYICHLKGRKHGRTIEALGGCLGCHILPDQDITIGNLTYNHKAFLGAANISCDSCHQDVVVGEGDVPADRCVVCHNEPDKLDRYSEELFIHDNHVTQHNTACFHCHTEIKHATAPAGTKQLTLECGSCHPTMHGVQRSFYTGMGARDVPPNPSPMYLANVDCVACHLDEKRRNGHVETYLGTDRGCTDCHGDEYVGMLDAVHEVMSETQTTLNANLETIRKGLPEGWEEEPGAARLEKSLDDTAYNLDYLGESYAVHNIYYAAQILRHADETLVAIGKEQDIDLQGTSEQQIITGAFCATLCHKRVNVNVPPETVTLDDGREMPHLEHTEMDLGCTYCHSFGQHKEVSLLSPTPCDECHD